MSKGLIFGLESKQEPLENWTKRSKLAMSAREIDNLKRNNSSRKMYQICIKMSNPCGPQVDIQSNLAIRNFLVVLKLFLNAKSSLSL